MPELNVLRNDNRVLELESFLSRGGIGSLATTDGGEAFLTTVFFVYGRGCILFYSKPGRSHSVHLRKHARASFAAHLETSNYGARYGAQVVGLVSRIRDIDAMRSCVELYGNRFAGAAADLPSLYELCSENISSTFYELRIEKFKLTDESRTLHRTMRQYQPFARV